MGATGGPRRLHSRRHHCSLRTPRARTNFPFAAFAAFVLNMTTVPTAPTAPTAPTVLPQGLPSYHHDCEMAVNIQIRMQLYASLVYLGMAAHFDRVKVALRHFSSFLLRRSHTLREGAEKFMWMQNRRGGRVDLRNVRGPNRDDWTVGSQAVECALHLEETLRQSLLLLHSIAADRDDSDLCAFVLCHYLTPQDAVLKELGEYLAKLREVEALREGLENAFFCKLSLKDNDEDN